MSDQPAEIAQIAVYLAKDKESFSTVIDAEAGLSQRPALREFDFVVDGASCKFIYFEQPSAKSNPPWLSFINEQLPPKSGIQFESFSKSANGLLLITIEQRIFVAAFGRSAIGCLNYRALEPDFGIKTAMNMCGNEEVRQTKSQSTAVAVTHIDRQISKPSETFAFGLNDAEDLKYISAHMKGDRNITLQGKDNLTLKVVGDQKLQWPALIKRCGEFLKKYGSKDYEALFPNYRNFRAATEVEAEALNEIMIKALVKRQFSKFQFAVPEFFSDDEYSFSYTNNAKRDNVIYAYLDVKQLGDHLKLDKVTIKELNARRIYAYSAEDAKVLDNKWWSLFECLIFESKLGSKYFILNGGEWSELDPSFYASIVKFIKTKVREEKAEADFKNIDISDDASKQNREGVFNAEVVRRRPKAILFDTAKLRISSGRKDKEFCDVLDLQDDKVIRIINAKRLKDASSIVYLFAQAKMYCDAFLHDEVFLNEIRGFISKSKCPAKSDYLAYIQPSLEKHLGSDYRLCLWLLYDKRDPKPEVADMPMIAQYELKLMHDHLQRVCKFKDVIVRFIPVSEKQYKTARSPN
jgi:uncharacterized protein (TIGR04141 family)